MPKQLPLTVVDSKKFTWARKSTGCVGVAEASDLEEHLASRVWNDACDVGFLVEGKHSTLLFTHVRDVRDNEGELVAWVFEAKDQPSIEIHVFND